MSSAVTPSALGRSAGFNSGSQSGAFNLTVDDEAVLLRAIRQVPEAHSDSAWAFIAARLRYQRYPDVEGTADDVVERYGGRE